MPAPTAVYAISPKSLIANILSSVRLAPVVTCIIALGQNRVNLPQAHAGRQAVAFPTTMRQHALALPIAPGV